MTAPTTPPIPVRDLRRALADLAAELAPRVSRLDRGEAFQLLSARFDMLVAALAPDPDD